MNRTLPYIIATTQNSLANYYDSKIKGLNTKLKNNKLQQDADYSVFDSYLDAKKQRAKNVNEIAKDKVAMANSGIAQSSKQDVLAKDAYEKELEAARMEFEGKRKAAQNEATIKANNAQAKAEQTVNLVGSILKFINWL